MTLNDIFGKSNEELIEWFRKEMNEFKTSSYYDEFHRRCEERRQNIENDFAAEWSKKRLKWFFKKRRQQKLHREIELRYPGPVIWIIEDMIDETLPKTTNEFFGQIIDVKENTNG